MRIIWAVLCVLGYGLTGFGAMPEFDFRDAGQVKQWAPTHDLAGLEGTAEGMLLRISGGDPYTLGPARDYPEGVALRATVRLRATDSGTLEVFYFKRGPSQAQSVRAELKGGAWTDVKLRLPALGSGYRLRIDPPGDRGECIIESIRIEAANVIPQPVWPKPAEVIAGAGAGTSSVRSGDLTLTHAGQLGQGFTVSVGGVAMAIGWNRGLIGHIYHDRPVWIPLDVKPTVQVAGQTIVETSRVRDEGGGNWLITRRYTPATQPGAIDVETSVGVDQNRSVIFVSMFGLFPGAGSFGASKHQALSPGLEYLGDEPSSSEADVIGPASHRQVPDSIKITFPLMTVAAKGKYVGLIWEPRAEFSAVFDSPDRLFGSGGHVMGVIFPGSDGLNRVEGSLLPDEAVMVEANKPILLKATIIGGSGDDVTGAVRQYISLRGLPSIPKPLDAQTFFEQAASGWLDSGIRAGDRYRHAIPGNFGAHSAADAAMYQDWLAEHVSDPALKQKLRDAASSAIEQVAPKAYDAAAVSHVRYPVQSLIYGHVSENVEEARRRGHALLARFETDGSVRYRPPAKVDLGKTNPTPEANGLTAPLVAQVLEDAAITGDPELIREGLRLLHAMDKFAGDVPRGAQTWEVPLHTPDVLASAHLVRAYTLGYELSGDEHSLELARYWAWTGVPFIYLTSPSEPVGPYAGIAVFGATQWTAPVWMGLPVQWCALVYADALYRLERHDPTGPWKQLADGITVSGIAQSWPKGSDAMRQGLLPDSFSLRSQVRHDPGINPGTLMAEAARVYGKVPLYDFVSARKSGLLIHAPGKISDVEDTQSGAKFEVEGWSGRPYNLLVAGIKAKPEVRIDGRVIGLGGVNEFDEAGRRLVLQVKGRVGIELRLH
ncbi:MAG TPA: hypothetical protein VIM11_22970 [Tepidisphaeraceae bacterium]